MNNNFTPEEINRLLSNSSAEIPANLKNGISDEQMKKLNSILSDKEKLNVLLNSQKAQELLKKFKNGG
ncbi:MAG: hypothetical protein IJM97_08085 [Clostridia bacterium]|nr:hypothetical protein [Clostridia bacterium]